MNYHKRECSLTPRLWKLFSYNYYSYMAILTEWVNKSLGADTGYSTIVYFFDTGASIETSRFRAL